MDLDAGFRIGELGYLNRLKGELNIYHLEHVRDEKEAKNANLAEKEKLYKLGFHWSKCNLRKREDNPHIDENVLEGLQPHRYLKSLTIADFGGGKFPSWMLAGCIRNDLVFDNLIEINLQFCRKCEEVPTLGHLPCLKVLKIIGLG